MEMEAMKQFGRALSGADTFTGIQESWMVIQLWALSTLFSNSFPIHFLRIVWHLLGN